MLSRLNLKPDGNFVPCSMPELFSKTGHEFTDIIAESSEFKLQ